MDLSRRQLLALSGGVVLLAGSRAEAAGKPLTIPALRSWKPASGGFRYDAGTRIVVHDRALADVADVLADDLHDLTGRRPRVHRGAPRTGDLVLALGERDRRVGHEGYRLTVGPTTTVRGATPAGVFYGTRSVLQLLRQSRRIPAGEALDWPRYPERGLMVDSGNKHYSMAWFASHLKELAYLKCNLLHLHFGDNGGIRIQSRRHPEVVSAAHLTQSQVRELVALAARYFITVVPELDMPGHMGAALAKHPDLQLVNPAGQGAQPYTVLDITKPEARRFTRELIEEYAPLFPGPYWHLGGDEYMPSAELPLYPQLLTYAQAKHGQTATHGDALIDFFNEMDDVVRRTGKKTRLWSDELGVGSAATLHKGLTVDWWINVSPLSDPLPPTPQAFLDAGQKVANCGWFPTYYTTGQTGRLFPDPDLQRAYEKWEPHEFYGSFFAPPVAGQVVSAPPDTLDPAEPRNLGSKVHVWSADNEPDATTTAALKPRLRILAQKTWGSPLLAPTYAGFQPVIAAVGRAPGWRLG
jgi:hexosaminidase